MKKLLLLAAVTLVFATAGTASADGAKAFKNTCSSCHGQEGAGGTGMAPALAGNDFIKNSDEATIKATIENGRKGGDKKYKEFPSPMPSWKGKVKDADIDAIVKYLKSLNS